MSYLPLIFLVAHMTCIFLIRDKFSCAYLEIDFFRTKLIRCDNAFSRDI